ncbi:MAG: pyridoxamine 5'-phosphate oxidase family protein [Desulfobacterales bacterium]|nr:pyridoxamine 5'-phosphate oxidase family protein [Desulfobacterales bacterium]
MRRKDKEVIDTAAIEAILAEARICRFAMVDGDRPYVVPMCFAHHENALYLHSALKGKKIEVLEKNPNVCFEVDTLLETIESDAPCDWSMRYQSVIGFGRAVFVEEEEEKRNALDIIFKRYAGRHGTFTDNKVQATAVIRINIDSMTGKMSGTECTKTQLQ